MIPESMKKGGDILLDKVKRHTRPYYIHVDGIKLKVFPGVFSPKYFLDSEFFVKNFPSQSGKDLLEIGSGTGIMAVKAALMDARSVTATDINPKALANIKENVHLHKIQDKVTVIKSDVYDQLPLGKTYDSIFWNVPFGQIKKKRITLLERALYDPGYVSLQKYITQAKKFLKRNGKLYIGFSTSMGDTDQLFALLKKSKFKWHITASTFLKTGHPGGPVKFELIEAGY